MKKIKLNTNICPILSINTYNTLLEIPTDHIDNDIEELKNNGVEVPNNIDNDTIYNLEKYGNDLVDFALQHIVNHVNDKEADAIPFKLKFYKETCFYSPKFYNFIGYSFDFDVQVNNGWTKDFIKFVNKENKWENFKKHCKKFDSCSGFISFYPIPCYTDTAKSFFERITDKNEDYFLSLVLTILIGYDSGGQYSFEMDWLEHICDKQDEYCSNKTVMELRNKYF